MELAAITIVDPLNLVLITNNGCSELMVLKVMYNIIRIY